MILDDPEARVSRRAVTIALDRERPARRLVWVVSVVFVVVAAASAAAAYLTMG